MDIDIDQLHTDLEASPNNVDALTQLIAFYRAEGAMEELTELYLTQLEVQTEDRLNLYVGLADVMETALELTQDARVVILEGLEEFPEAIQLWEMLERLSKAESEKTEYVALLTRQTLKTTSEAMLIYALPHMLKVSDNDFRSYLAYLEQFEWNQAQLEFTEHMFAFSNSLELERTQLCLTFVTNTAIEVDDEALLQILLTQLTIFDHETLTQYIGALRNRAYRHEDTRLIHELFKSLVSVNANTKDEILQIIGEIAVSLEDWALLDQLHASCGLFTDAVFEQYLQIMSTRAQRESNPEIFTALSHYVQTCSAARQTAFQTTLRSLALAMDDPNFMFDVLETSSGQEEEAREQYLSTLENTIVTRADEALLERTIRSTFFSDTRTALLFLRVFIEHAQNEALATHIESWMLTHAPVAQLDKFIDEVVALNRTPSSIAELMAGRARRCGNDAAAKAVWQHKALRANPSPEALSSYLDTLETLDESTLSFIGLLLTEADVDAKVGLQTMLNAFEVDREPQLTPPLIELLIREYRRGETFTADHQRTIETLVRLEQSTLAAGLLKDSAAQESDVFIQRNLFLDAGDHLLRIDPKAAARCYYKAFETKDDDRVILSKLLDAYQADQDWKKSIKVLRKLASLGSDNAMKAKYLYAMGVIQRDKLSDHYRAVRTFDKALDQDPTLVKAIQAIDEVITNDEDYERQDRYYRKCLARAVNHNADSRVIFQLAQNLATLNISKLENDDAAIQALKVARAHSSDTAAIDKQLLGIYRANGALESALGLHYAELERNPLKVRSYRELFITLRAFGLPKSAACVGRTLAVLGHSDEPTSETSTRERSSNLQPFGQHMWSLIRPKTLNTVFDDFFRILAPAIFQTYALEDSAYRFSRPEPLGPSTIPAVFTEVVSALRVPLPAVWFSTESSPVALVHRMTPALVLGPGIDRLNASEQKFLASRSLFMTKPEYFLASHPSPLEERLVHLTGLFNGALQLIGTGKLDKHVLPLIKRTLSLLDEERLTALKQLLDKYGQIAPDQLLTWLQDVDRMASRVGFVLTDNLDIATRLTRDMKDTISDLPVSETLTDLLLFSVSKDYLMSRGDLADKVKR